MTKMYYIRRIVLCLLIICLCLLLISISVDVPGWTDAQRFRQAEKAQVVGPSTILGSEDLPMPTGKVMIGESNYGYSLYECDSGKLYYHRKMENFTTCAPNDLSGYDLQNRPPLPIFVFTENRHATHARLSMRLVSTLSGAPWESTYTVKAQRSENGYFLFSMDLDEEIRNGSLEFLTEMLNNLLCSRPWMHGSVTLELYDGSGNLLETYVHPYNTPTDV